VKVRKSSEETLEMLQSVYGTEAMIQVTVFWWGKHFKDGSKRVIDDVCSGR
jgi:hypothetical protein